MERSNLASTPDWKNMEITTQLPWNSGYTTALRCLEAHTDADTS